MPVDTLAIMGAEEGYLLTGLRVVSADAASSAPVRAGDPSRFAAGWRRAGGAAGEMLWQFPLPQHQAGDDAKALHAFWSERQGNDASQELLRQLVLALRIWRPEVLLTNHPGTKSPGNILLGEALLEAAKRAGDAKAFPEQLQQLALSAWSVKKLYYVWDKNDAQIVMDNNTFQPRLEASAGDYAATALDLLVTEPRPVPGQRYYRLVYSALAGADKQTHMMHGMAMAVRDTRREVGQEPVADAELVKALSQRHNLLQLAQP